METVWLFVGLVLVLIGLLVIVMWLFTTKVETEWGFGGFIGPIPFGFASSQTMFYVVIILIALLAVLSLALTWLR